MFYLSSCQADDRLQIVSLLRFYYQMFNERELCKNTDINIIFFVIIIII